MFIPSERPTEVTRIWRRRFSLASGLVLATTFCARTSHAQEALAAEALFRAGRTAYREGDYVTACAKFGESNRLGSQQAKTARVRS